MEGYRKISEEERQRRKNLEQVRIKEKKRKIRNAVVSTVLIATVAIIGVWLCYTKFFVIKKCTVKGEIPYSADEVLTGAGLEKGMLLYELDKKTVEKNVMYNLPYIDSFKMKRYWSGNVVFEVQKAIPSMYVTLSDECYVLSQSLRVLSQTNDFSYIESQKLIHLRTNDIERCVAGEFLQTRSDIDKTVMEIYDLLTEHNLLSYVSEIDLTDRFSISFTYKQNFVVELGDGKNLDKKIRFMLGIEEKLHEGSSGIIDVSGENVKEGIVKSF